MPRVTSRNHRKQFGGTIARIGNSRTQAMHTLLLPLSARFIVYTFVLLITAILLFELLFWWSSVYVAIPLALFAALSVIGTIDLLSPNLWPRPGLIIRLNSALRIFHVAFHPMKS